MAVMNAKIDPIFRPHNLNIPSSFALIFEHYPQVPPLMSGTLSSSINQAAVTAWVV
jgi:hypothetical protein